jgi:hypothetical protein
VKLTNAADVAAHRADWKRRLAALSDLAAKKPVASRGRQAS